MKSPIFPVVLCGGSGTRLWPLSRKSFPKQFARITGDKTLFQRSIERTSGDLYQSPMVVTSDDFRFVVREQLQECDAAGADIVIEPEGKNTAPAVLAAALLLARRDPHGVMLLSPSDHVIPNVEAFNESVASALDAARAGEIITFGIKPERAETGYGWLELGSSNGTGLVKLQAFKEKPDVAEAKRMFDDGRYLWNSGIFLFSVDTIINAFRQHAPDMCTQVQASVDATTSDLEFLRLGEQAWRQVQADSIDYAVMEKSRNLSVVPFDAGWSDLGGWDAVLRESDAGDDGVALHGQATGIECENTLLRSEDDSLELVGLGLKDTVVVAMPDAVLVADSSRSQDVKKAVAVLKQKEARQAEHFRKDRRPWGWFETLALGNRYQVKKIVVNPGGVLSLQSHVHRSEHWIVVSGTAKVTIDKDVRLITENQSVYIPLGATHRMENPGKLPMTLIEVQTGVYLGEDDIVRYEDVYARS